MAILTLTALLVWRVRHSPSPVTKTIVPPKPAESTAAVVTQPTNTIAVSKSTIIPATTNSIYDAQLNDARRRLEGLSTLNDIPIIFYGKLEDQFGNPVVGAEVTGSTIIYNGTRTGSESASMVSDSNGFFKLDIGKGEILGIMPKKTGYVLATTSTFFKYSHLEPNPYVPDPNNPTIIKMWKLQGGEHLIHFQAQIRVPIDGSPITLDLQAGQQVQAGGDITISVETTPKPNVRQRYDWQVTIQAEDGGLISSSDDFEQMFQAPKLGYDPKFVVNYQKDVRPWSTTFNGIFHFTSRSGSCYGKFAIEVLSDVVKDGTVPVILNSYINPAGSRNLEIDPAKVTEAHP